MFDIGFSELILIGVVALLVLGPDRLPGAARVAGLWLGRIKRSFNTIKEDVERELGADDIRRELRNEGILEKVGEEAVETILAAKDAATSNNSDDVIYETADLWFHSLVMLSALDLEPQTVLDELERRFGLSGHAEKAARSTT